MGTWPEEIHGFMFCRVIFLWICPNCHKGRREKEAKKRIREAEGTDWGVNCGLWWPDQTFDFRRQCRGQELLLLPENIHLMKRNTSIGEFWTLLSWCTGVVSWNEICVRGQAWCWELRVENTFASVSLKKPFFLKTVSFLFNVNSIHKLCSVSAHLHYSRLTEYQSFSVFSLGTWSWTSNISPTSYTVSAQRAAFQKTIALVYQPAFQIKNTRPAYVWGFWLE